MVDIEATKNDFFYNAALTKARKVFIDTKKNPNEGGIKSFFPPKFTEYFPKDQQNGLLNAMNQYNGRNKIINKVFENKNIMSSYYALGAKSGGVKESEQKFDESIGERVNLRMQKVDDKKDETGDERLDIIDIPDLETEESAAQRRSQSGRRVKILTPGQMLSRLPISLAQLK